ncbi:MAG TPA: serine kinase [Dyella sp.]|uniref:serine kinase n=1 Tax=Dyella sp. TaxID=1869338 RepID=UPI002F949285
MALSQRDDVAADPFRERVCHRFSVSKQILGGHFRFESASEALLRLVEAAYGGLPPHPLLAAEAQFEVELRLLPRRATPHKGEPPGMTMQSGAGLICSVMDEANYVVLSPEQGRALVVASTDMLEHAYHLRYELIEFAVFTLATRRLGLVPLHGACVGHRGRGVLLLGNSGNGKTTLTLHSLLGGLDVLAEDAVFVQPASLLATGVANYLHLKSDAVRFIDDAAIARWIVQSPTIRRRSGVEKFEVDLRHAPGRPAYAPLRLVGAVFVSAETAEDPDSLLQPVPDAEAAALLIENQPYACGQPGWDLFTERVVHLGVHRLRRGRHPRDAIAALHGFLSAC